MQKLIIFPVIFIVTILIDYIWIGLLANHYYLDAFSSFGRIAHGKLVPIIWAAGVVYVLLTIAMTIFVVWPAGQEAWMMTLLKGALLGACVYGIYDFTNYATIANWTLFISLLDMAWGAFLCGVTSVIGRALLPYFS